MSVQHEHKSVSFAPSERSLLENQKQNLDKYIIV